jgi:transposase-like protein
MKKDLREIYLAPNRASAEVAINVFAEKYGAKYDKAVECLTKDREALLALYERNRKAPQGHSNSKVRL